MTNVHQGPASVDLLIDARLVVNVVLSMELTYVPSVVQVVMPRKANHFFYDTNLSMPIMCLLDSEQLYRKQVVNRVVENEFRRL